MKVIENDKQSKFIEFIKSIFRGYSQIYFSNNWKIGILFFLATLVIPYQGIAGLFGLLLSIFFANIFELSEENIKNGYFAYNGLLIALALGLTYRFNLAFFIMLVLSIFIGVLVSQIVKFISDKYFGIPVLSLPFVITTWIVIAAGQKFPALIYATRPFEIKIFENFFNGFFKFYFKSIGAAFFQINILSGIVIAIGIFIFSRYAFFLTTISIILGYNFQELLGVNLIDIQHNYIGFNFALTAIAIGGVFVVPSIYSFFLAMFAVLATTVLSSGLSIILSQLNLPILAAPFLFATMAIIYTLKTRFSSKYIIPNLVLKETPEKNLKYYKNYTKRFVDGTIPIFELPVYGVWTITQSFNGEHTHKNFWAYALDFEVTDDTGKTYKNSGDYPEDYYAYNMPVLAPLDGKVTNVIDHINDNIIGQTNQDQNWGNTVVIWHYGTIYTAYSHLKRGTISVKVGDIVKKGQMIGRVGNTGRSPYPHMHFQVQALNDIGSPTIKYEIINYVVYKNSTWYHITHGVPKKNDIIKNINSSLKVYESVAFPLGKKWKFIVNKDNEEIVETWETDIDFLGNRYLVCKEKGAKVQFYINNKILLLVNYEEKNDSALRWFYLGNNKIPFTEEKILWQEDMPADLFLTKIKKEVFDIFEPFVSLATLKCNFSILDSAEFDNFKIRNILELKGALYNSINEEYKIETEYKRYKGLLNITVFRNGNEYIKITQKEV